MIKKTLRKIIIISVIATVVLALSAIGIYISRDYFFPDDPVTEMIESGGIAVHFVDVGQADCILIMTDEGNMLIDTGTSSSEGDLKTYLDENNIEEIEYLVLTHPHDDHIGGADMVVRDYTVKNVIMTDAKEDAEVYYSLMSQIYDKKINVIYSNSGDTFTLGGVKSMVLAPNRDVDEYDESNSTSIVLKCEFADCSMMITGDAEVDSEYEMIEEYGDFLDCDILKLGHHGSKTSSSYEFLEITSPDIAVACCGKDNTYGHPAAEVMYRLELLGIELLRTDKEGSILFLCDGKEFEYIKKD